MFVSHQLGLVHVHQPEIRLVDQSRRLERLAGLLLNHLFGRQFAQLVIDQRQQLLSGLRIALFDGIQDLGDIAHKKRK